VKYPTASSAKGGGGTNMTRNPVASGSVPHRGTQGTGDSNVRMKGAMGGGGTPGQMAKGVQSGSGNHTGHEGVIGTGHENAVPAKGVMGRG